MIAILSATLGLRVPPPPAASAVLSRRGALFAGLTAASGLASPAAFAAEATKECLSGCFKECNAITKSGAYCSEQCDAYCSEEGAKGAGGPSPKKRRKKVKDDTKMLVDKLFA